jgi:hypothetical protein
VDIFASFATDDDLEKNGARVDLGQGASIRVARANSRAYSKLLAKLVDQHKSVLDKDDAAADAKSDEIMVEVMAQTLLKGWDGLKYKGKVLPYSLENARLILAHKDFRRVVAQHADNFDNFRALAEAAAEKN